MVADASAQSSRSGKKSEKAEVMFPGADRKEPATKSSSKASKKLQKLIDVYNDQDYPQTRVLADELLALEGANEYDRSVAAQLGAQAAYNLDDAAGAKAYLKQVIQFNGLDNNGHFQSMLMLAQLQLADDELDPYYPRWTASSPKPSRPVRKTLCSRARRSTRPSASISDPGVEAGDRRHARTQGQLGAAADGFVCGDQPERPAVALAEQLAAKNPADKKAQMNLASVYGQADQMDKAAGVLEKLRASGQLSEEREYRQLYVTYANMDGREKDVISVINEGIQKGALKPDYQTYLALAQSYYYSDQISQAIENWQKAAPLSKDGETYLNLARVLWQEGRTAEAKQAAQQRWPRA